MRCAVYVRVSTDEQAKVGYSLAAQTDRLTEFAKGQGWSVLEIFSDDGYSAANKRRPALEAALDAAREKRFDVLLVYKIDRLSRRLKDLIEIVEELAKYGVGFKSITELIDTTTPEGRLMFHQFGSFAQYERELIAQRTKMGMLKRLKGGLWNGGPAPYGYNLNGKGLEINMKEAKVVRNIYELSVKENLGVINIARYLNKHGVNGPRGKKWRPGAVHRVLTNHVYTGEIIWGGERVTGTHKPIIKEELFNKVKLDLKERKAKTRGLVSPNLLTGLVFCKCGAAMHVVYPGIPPKSRFKYYVCTSRAAYKNCDTEYIRADILETSAMAEINKLSSDLPRIKQFLDRAEKEYKENLPALTKERDKARRKLNQLNAEKENLIKWMSQKAAKPFTLNVINEKIEKIEPEINGLTHKLWQIEESLDRRLHFGLSAEKVSQYFKKIVETFADFSLGEKRKILAGVLQKIKVVSKKEIHLFLKAPQRVNPLGSTITNGSPNRI
jgi:site-specific DNA recombinase